MNKRRLITGGKINKLANIWIQKKYRIAFSIFSAIILTFFTYFANNQDKYTTDNTVVARIAQKFYDRFFDSDFFLCKPDDYSNVVFINISNDQELADIKSDNESVLFGHCGVTDRGKVTKFLEYLQEIKGYKFIILDIYFDSNNVTKHDDALWSQLEKTDRLVFVNNGTVPFFRENLRAKTAYAKYTTTLKTTNFVRFKYTDNGRLYIPSMIVESEDSLKQFKQYGRGFFAIYKYGNKLCQNSSFIKFDATTVAPYRIKGDNTKYVYYDLGFDFLRLVDGKSFSEDYLKAKISKLTDNKYVVICDMENDMHDTYIGRKPGGVIIYKALQSIQNGDIYVKWWYYLFYIIIFFFTCYKLSNNTCQVGLIPPFNKLSKFFNFKFMNFLLTFISINVIIWVLQFFEYLVLGSAHSMIIPVVYLTLTKIYFDYIKFNVQ